MTPFQDIIKTFAESRSLDFPRIAVADSRDVVGINKASSHHRAVPVIARNGSVLVWAYKEPWLEALIRKS